MRMNRVLINHNLRPIQLQFTRLFQPQVIPFFQNCLQVHFIIFPDFIGKICRCSTSNANTIINPIYRNSIYKTLIDLNPILSDKARRSGGVGNLDVPNFSLESTRNPESVKHIQTVHSRILLRHQTVQIFRSFKK